MTWYAIEIAADPERRETIAAWLVGRTGQAIEERADGTLVSFALDLPAALALEHELIAAHGAVTTRRQELAEVDWTTAWRAGLDARRVGRFVVTPTWIPASPAAGEFLITLDPEMAFGSGEHGSTRGALTLVERWVKPGDAVLDLGTGSGILAIAAARLGAASVVGVELDADSLPAAMQNVERNGVGNVVRFLEGDAGAVTPLLGPADVVVSNILRLVNVALLPGIHRALRLGGTGIFAGMEVGEATDFRAPLLSAGFQILQEVIDDGWWSVAAERV